MGDPELERVPVPALIFGRRISFPFDSSGLCPQQLGPSIMTAALKAPDVRSSNSRSAGARRARAVPLQISLESRWLGRRFSNSEYERMIDNGIIKSGEPVELLDGMVVPKMSKNAAHRIATRLARRVLESALPKGWYLDSQEPISLPELHVGAGNVPEPDAAIIRGDSEDYPVGHPSADVVALVVEVSDSTLRDDRGFKKRIYAHARIPEYWIVNLIDHQLEVYQRPMGSGLKADYEVTRTLSLSESVSVRIGNKTVGPIPVKSFFPKR